VRSLLIEVGVDMYVYCSSRQSPITHTIRGGKWVRLVCLKLYIAGKDQGSG
jgi:hypothetical protein